MPTKNSCELLRKLSSKELVVYSKLSNLLVSDSYLLAVVIVLDR